MFRSDRDFEAAALNHYLEREPELQEVTISVRKDGELVRLVLLRPTRETVRLFPSGTHDSLLGD
jgi:hypothetical protein